MYHALFEKYGRDVAAVRPDFHVRGTAGGGAAVRALVDGFVASTTTGCSMLEQGRAGPCRVRPLPEAGARQMAVGQMLRSASCSLRGTCRKGFPRRSR